jgi:hypothetical protein
MIANPLALSWIKVRAGKQFTDKQIETLEKTRLQVTVFLIRDILESPSKIETRWETKSANEWLDELDEKREEAESDDDYL